MPDFSQRSNQKELLDSDSIPFEDIKQNMKELDFINTYLGGHEITLKGISSFISNSSDKQMKPIIICEIGCGGGDNLRVIKKYCEKNKILVHLIGIDINPHCISYAQSREENAGIEFVTSGYNKVVFDKKPAVIFSSLFCHHFTNEELVHQFNWMKEHAKLGFFINDLQRHWLAYASIKLLTGFFSKSYLVKNDAPLSVLRGFSKKDLLMINNQLSIFNFQLTWCWAFRWLLIFKHDR